MTTQEQTKLIVLCGRVFSPSAPVNSLDLFAGRLNEIQKVSSAVNARGRHAIMYGDRGVGKTSLANILQEVIHDISDAKVIKITCNQNDTYRAVWRRAFAKIPVIQEAHANEDEKRPTEYSLDQYLDNNPDFGPGEICQLLASVSGPSAEHVIVFDEFDRMIAGERRLFPDTIKDLSDNSINATLALVGVARDVVDLLAEHGSVDRCLSQIRMPPMTRDELRTIMTKALGALKLEIEARALDMILLLSQGFPHYTHLLGQESALIAIKQGQREITSKELSDAIPAALQHAQETVRDEYYKASEGQRQGTLYPQVLLACALAEQDELGFFKSTGVRNMLRDITKKEYKTQNFAQHLKKFSTDDARGPVLEHRGSQRRYKFRFRNAMLRPFIIMKGLEDKLLSGTLLQHIAATAAAAVAEEPKDDEVAPAPTPPGERQRTLFD